MRGLSNILKFISSAFFSHIKTLLNFSLNINPNWHKCFSEVFFRIRYWQCLWEHPVFFCAFMVFFSFFFNIYIMYCVVHV